MRISHAVSSTYILLGSEFFCSSTLVHLLDSITFGCLALANFRDASLFSSMCLAIENADEPSGELSDTAGFRLMNGIFGL